MDIGRQIAALKQKRGDVLKNMETLAALAGQEGRVFTDEETKNFEGKQKEILDIDAQVVRLEALEKTLLASAQRATDEAGNTANVPASTIGGLTAEAIGTAVATAVAEVMKGINPTWGGGARSESEASKQKGLRMARVAIAHAATRNEHLAAEYAEKRWKDTPEVAMFLRAAVSPMQVGEATNSAYLTTIAQMQQEFIDLLRPKLIMSRLPGVRTLQFGPDEKIVIPKQTSGASGGYVGEGNSIVVNRLAFGQIQMVPSKLACLVPMSNELILKSNPSIEMLVRDDLIQGTARTADAAFFSSAAAGAAPAGILNSISATTLAAVSTTPTVQDISDSIRVLIQSMRNNNVNLDSPCWVMHPRTVEYMRFQRAATGAGSAWAWKDELDQGKLAGYPYVTSTTLPTNLGAGTNASYFSLIDCAQVILAEDAGVVIDASAEASIQADTAPGTPPTGVISAFQQDMTIIRLRLKHTWARRLDVAFTYGLILC